jgi:light-regulated signal transduction histidine kinase (bacteriophytochrome)
VVNRELRREEDAGMGVEIYFNGQRHFITADRLQILNLLLSTYDAAIQRNKELNRSQEELKLLNSRLDAVNKELESFSYSVSHDLRAPLRYINGYVEMLAADIHDQVGEEPRRFMKVIADASKQMGQLIDDLLEFSRMGRVEMRELQVDMNALVLEVRSALEAEIQERNIEWKIPRLPAVTGDPALLRQALSNLLGNSVKYSRNRDPAVIEMGLAGEEAGRIVFFVRDNGAGFDMKYAGKLFGVFQRLHRQEEFEGTGVGLANVERVITRHGGRVWAEAAPDKGATFYFTLKPAN